jgi:hypothetical protein
MMIDRSDLEIFIMTLGATFFATLVCFATV